MKTISGTTEKCIAHFADRSDSIELLARMLPNVHIRTIERWLEDAQEPHGENLIRMRVLLSELGYGIVEHQQLEPIVARACEALTFDVVSSDELVAIFGFEGNTNPSSQLYKILRGAAGMVPERLEQVTALATPLENAIEDAQRIFRAKFRLGTGDCRGPGTDRVIARTHERRDVDAKAVLDALAHSIEAILPLVERVLTDDYTPEDREYVRNQTGGNGVFKAANALYRLCGERARSTISKSSKGGVQQ